MKKYIIAIIVGLVLFQSCENFYENEFINYQKSKTTTSMAFYTIKNREVNLTISGLSDFKLADGGIKIKWDIVHECIVVPKFTFDILGRTTDIIAQLGAIGRKTHTFQLSFSAAGKEFNFSGYLVPDMFSNANTGYEEIVSLKGILDIEYLDDATVPVDFTSASFSLQDMLFATIQSGSSVTDVQIYKSFTEGMGYANTENLIDDDNFPFSSAQYVKEVCKTFNMLAWVYNSSTEMIIYDRAYLATMGGDDYSLLQHRGINENIEIDPLILDYTVKVSNYDKNMDLTPDMQNKRIVQDTPYNISLRGRKNDGGAFHKSNKWFQHERAMGYFSRNDFYGWTFPKYTANSQTPVEITAWDDPDQIFTSVPSNPIFGTTQPKKYPKRGMYPVSWRAREYNKNNTPEQGWSEITDEAVIIVNSSEDGVNYYKNPSLITVMRYNGNIALPKGSALYINYSQARSNMWTWDGKNYATGNQPFKMHEDIVDWSSAVSGENDPSKSWGQAPIIPINESEADWQTNISFLQQYQVWKVKFANKWFNGTDWVDTESTFVIPVEKENLAIGDYTNVKINNPNSRLSSMTGFEIQIPDNMSGELVIELLIGNLSDVSGAISYHLFLKDLSVKTHINPGLLDVIRQRTDTLYTTLTNTKQDELKEDMTIMFHSTDGHDLSRSQLYSDAALQNKIDKFNYTIGSYNINEKLEHHLIRWNTGYKSGMYTIMDMLFPDDIRMFYTYKGQNMFLSILELNIMAEEVRCGYSYNGLNTIQ